MNGVNVRRVWDAACSVGRVRQPRNRPPTMRGRRRASGCPNRGNTHSDRRPEAASRRRTSIRKPHGRLMGRCGRGPAPCARALRARRRASPQSVCPWPASTATRNKVSVPLSPHRHACGGCGITLPWLKARNKVSVPLSPAELCEARDVPPGRRCANAPPAAPLRESRRYNGGADMNGVNVRRVWDAACSVSRVRQPRNRPPSADTANATVLKLVPFTRDPL